MAINELWAPHPPGRLWLCRGMLVDVGVNTESTPHAKAIQKRRKMVDSIKCTQLYVDFAAHRAKREVVPENEPRTPSTCACGSSRAFDQHFYLWKKMLREHQASIVKPDPSTLCPAVPTEKQGEKNDCWI